MPTSPDTQRCATYLKLRELQADWVAKHGPMSSGDDVKSYTWNDLPRLCPEDCPDPSHGPDRALRGNPHRG